MILTEYSNTSDYSRCCLVEVQPLGPYDHRIESGSDFRSLDPFDYHMESQTPHSRLLDLLTTIFKTSGFDLLDLKTTGSCPRLLTYGRLRLSIYVIGKETKTRESRGPVNLPWTGVTSV